MWRLHWLSNRNGTEHGLTGYIAVHRWIASEPLPPSAPHSKTPKYQPEGEKTDWTLKIYSRCTVIQSIPLSSWMSSRSLFSLCATVACWCYCADQDSCETPTGSAATWTIKVWLYFTIKQTESGSWSLCWLLMRHIDKPNFIMSCGPFNSCNWLMIPKLHVFNLGPVLTKAFPGWDRLSCRLTLGLRGS